MLLCILEFLVAQAGLLEHYKVEVEGQLVVRQYLNTNVTILSDKIFNEKFSLSVYEERYVYSPEKNWTPKLRAFSQVRNLPKLQ